MNVTSRSSRLTMPPEWQNERLHYEVLAWVYARTGAQCEKLVGTSEIGAALDLSYEDLYRSIEFLRGRGYLADRIGAAQLCITRKGITYLEILAGRRRSIRG